MALLDRPHQDHGTGGGLVKYIRRAHEAILDIWDGIVGVMYSTVAAFMLGCVLWGIVCWMIADPTPIEGMARYIIIAVLSGAAGLLFFARD